VQRTRVATLHGISSNKGKERWRAVAVEERGERKDLGLRRASGGKEGQVCVPTQ